MSISNVSVPEFRGYPVMMHAKTLNAEETIQTTATEVTIPDKALTVTVITASTTFSESETGVFIDAVERTIPVAGLTSIWFKNTGGPATVQLIWGLGE